MQNKKNMLKRNSFLFAKNGFTMIEMLLVIAIIGILSAAILVGISSQRDKARSSRILVELSGVIQPMMMCWADGGDVQIPSLGGVICKINGVNQPGYGTWPAIASQGWGYNGQDLSSSGGWYLRAVKTGSGEYICCNSFSDKCANMGSINTCEVDTPLP